MEATEPGVFGLLLRKHRIAAGLTQEELAERAGLSARVVSDLERGVTLGPQRYTVQQLALALGLSGEDRITFQSSGRSRPRSRPFPSTTGAIQEGPGIWTFLLADIRGYTRYTVEHGNEAAAQVIERFALNTRAVVAQHGGAVREFREDEALAVFRSARQALRAALALQKRFSREMRSSTGLPLKVGIGLDAGGTVPVVRDSRRGALNLASRLCRLAGPGEILASEGVVRLARTVEGLRYVERGEAQLRGFADPIRVVQVVPEEAEQTIKDETTAAVPQRPLPFGGFLGALPANSLVARDVELSSVMGAVDAVAGGSARVVFLAGEPGVGKTRLAQEVALHLRNRGFLVASGRCYEPQEAVPFYPFLEALQALYLAAPPSIRSVAPQRWPSLGHLLPNASFPGRPSSVTGKEEQERLFWSVTDFVQTVAGPDPMGLLLDDLQWADASSLALLQHLARHTRAHSVLLLGAYRDVGMGRHSPLETVLRDLNREQLTEHLAIRRLGLEGTRALIAASFAEDEISCEFSALVYRHTEGNPFFTHEVLRTLVERGDLYREHTRWVPREIEQIEVPESVRSIMGERLSHLSDDTQELLHQASVLGQVFHFDDLAAMMERSEEAVEEGLEEALAAGLIREARLDHYGFNHVLAQGALYAELSGRRKRRLHLAAGEALERSGQGERRAAELAWHFSKGDDPRRASRYALQAGDEAEAVFAHQEAERHYRTALEQARKIEESGREADALEKLGAVLTFQGQYVAAREALEGAAEMYRAGDALEALGRVTTAIGRVYMMAGWITSEAIDRLRFLLEPLEAGEPSLASAQIHTQLATLLFLSGRYEEQRAAGERGSSLASLLGDERTLIEAERLRCLALLELGQMDEGLRDSHRALSRAEALGHPDTLCEMVGQVGVGYTLQAAPDQGRPYLQRAAELAERVANPWQVCLWMACLGLNEFVAGHWPEARRHFDQALELGNHSRLPYVLWQVGWLDLAEGAWERAAEALEQSMIIPRQMGNLQVIRWASGLLAEIDLLTGRPAAARERLLPLLDRPGLQELDVTFLLPRLAWAHLELGDVGDGEEVAQQAVERAWSQRYHLALADALRVQGVGMATTGHQEEAIGVLEKAVALCHAMPYPYAEARALHEWGRIHGARGESGPARERLQAALHIFCRLGARPYIERTEQALAMQR